MMTRKTHNRLYARTRAHVAAGTVQPVTSRHPSSFRGGYASLRYLAEVWRWDRKSCAKRFLQHLASETLIDTHTGSEATRLIEDQQTATASLPRFGEHCPSQQARWPDFQPWGASVYLRKRRFEDSTVTPAGPPEERRNGLKARAPAHFRGEWREQWGTRRGEPGCTIPAAVIAEARQEAGRLQ